MKKKARNAEPEVEEGTLVELLLATAKPPPATPAGLVVGRLVAVSPIVVAFDERPDGVQARTTVALRRRHVGSQVTLAFERGDLARPIVCGVLERQDPVEAEVDGKPVVLEGTERIVLKCGKASITLRRDGKVEIKGTYVSTTATGTQRIRGGSVQIN